MWLITMKLIITVLTTLVMVVQSVHQSMYIRKFRSSEPVKSTYINKNYNGDAFSTDEYKSLMEPVLDTYTSTMTYNPPMYSITPVSKYNIDYEIAKAESKYNSNYLPSKIKSDIMYEKLKSAMRYHPPDIAKDMVNEYTNQYYLDDDDVRTSSRSTYDSRPYFYHSPYEYEHMKMDSDIEKAKDKRYAVDVAKDVIPVHEDVAEDVSNSYESPYTTSYYETTTDNPIMGHDPFFASMLNDYLHKKNLKEDHLVFRGLDFDKDFDHETNILGMDDYSKDDGYQEPELRFINESPSNFQFGSMAIDGKSLLEKGQQKRHDFDNHDSDNSQNSNEKVEYKQRRHNSNGFKDFVDTFANKFGGEDHKKDSKYVITRNQDNAENRKGFRRVYHKDEYQEDKEFFNNNNSSTKVEEKGGSNAHFGGSEAFIKSSAAAATGNKENALNKAGNLETRRQNGSRNNGLENGKLNENRNDHFKTAKSNNLNFVEYDLGNN